MIHEIQIPAGTPADEVIPAALHADAERTAEFLRRAGHATTAIPAGTPTDQMASAFVRIQGEQVAARLAADATRREQGIGE